MWNLQIRKEFSYETKQQDGKERQNSPRTPEEQIPLNGTQMVLIRVKEQTRGYSGEAWNTQSQW